MEDHGKAIELEAMLQRDNLLQAWKAVRRNKGGAGVDGLTIEQTWQHLKQHWPVIREKLLAGGYRPAAVRCVTIPKPNGGSRTLGIPTVQDRLIQQAMHQALNAALDGTMSDHSYGFRPGRSAHDAIAAASGYVAAGKRWVVDIDLKSFFDQVNHDRLMTMLGRQVRDKRVLKLIGGYLRAPMRQQDGTQIARTCGTPQGGPLSPLLANVYLDPLDKELERRGISFVRYADDIALFAGSERAAMRMLQSIKQWLRRELGLEINDDKSGSGPSDQTQLLGFRLRLDGHVDIAPKAMAKLKTKVRQLLNARQSVTAEDLRTAWSAYIEGWWNYFRFADRPRALKGVASWIRRHMRKFFWQRWHDRHGRRNALRRLGVPERQLNISGSRRGAWPLARTPIVQTALSTARLARFGLFVPWDSAGSEVPAGRNRRMRKTARTVVWEG
jgi:RNA-directed DNA polymerase